MNSMPKSNKKRSVSEQAEQYTVQSVNAPEERFQTEQQRPTAVQSGSNSAPDESFVPKEHKVSGQRLKQDLVSETLTGKGGAVSAGAMSASSFGLREMSFSGDSGTILGSAAGTPAMENSDNHNFQGHSRLDKRLSDANKDINFNASEQVYVEYDTIPPLAQSESTVGYNGNPKNVAARGQKNNGVTPSELLYDRSLDFVEKDEFVFVTGQVVKQAGVSDTSYPTKTMFNDKGEAVADPVDLGDDAQVRGNYSPRQIEIEITKDSTGYYVSNFEVQEDDFSSNSNRDTIVNCAATNHKIDCNRAELTRQRIDADAGSPTSEYFNPLGRSVKQPTATVTLLQDIENATGATIFAAYKFANKARGHYLNRTAKDGQDLTGPAVDALYGHLTTAMSQSALKSVLTDIDGDKPLFSKKGNAYGSAALMIYAFDSPTKYKTKADIVNQPRGLKMHIQTADNNINPFRAKKEFIAALNALDCYSTIGHSYDPMLPVYITDNVRLVYPYSWRKMLQFTRDKANSKKYQSRLFGYGYSAGSGQNKYYIKVADPVLNGVAHFLDLHAASLYNACEAKDGKVKITIPVVHSTTHFSLWDMLVCASTPYIIYERTNTFKDILDYEMFKQYPFDGNVRIADANPLSAVNYSNPGPTSPLSVGTMLPSASNRWVMGEMTFPTSEGVMMPYYFNERSYTWTATGKASKLQFNGDMNFSTPVIRSGFRWDSLDAFFDMEVKDNVLMADPMVCLPFDLDGDEFSGYVYKYSQDSDGLIVARKATTDAATIQDWCSTPRLLGWYMPAYAGACTPQGTSASAALSHLAVSTDVTVSSMVPAYRAVMYYNATAEKPSAILSAASVAVSRGQAFTQRWTMRTPQYSADDFDLPLSFNDCYKYVTPEGIATVALKAGAALYAPFVFGKYATNDKNEATNTADAVYADGENDKPRLATLHSVFWSLLQRLQFVLNPFDWAPIAESVVNDPWSIGYIFGLSGFLAANYDEEIYNRINDVQYSGYGYTRDPMTSASPVFKDAYARTEIG